MNQNSLSLIIEISKLYALLSRRLDAGLGGVGLNDFLVLYYLASAKDSQLRRIDLAQKIGLTASGVTRILLPMEKIGLITRQADSTDARVSFVQITKAGQEKYEEAIDRASILMKEFTQNIPQKKLTDIAPLLREIGKNINY